jgi:hypothetical protein
VVVGKKADATQAGNRAETAEKRVFGRPFQKGQSGNPNGRPKIPEEVRELARTYTIPAIKELAKLAGLVTVVLPNGDEAPVGRAMSEAVQRQALCDLLDRGYGKPTQAVEGTGDDGEIKIRFVD